MSLKMLSLMAAALLIGAQGFAEETTTTEAGETSLKIEDAANKKNKVDGDIDEEITNVRMRAESGSKSKWSLSSSMAYTGGAIDDVFGKNRPNLAALPGVQTQSSLDGSLSMRYRMNKNDSFTLGTAFGIMTPLHGDNTKAGQNQFNIWDPGVSYSRVFSAAGLQNIFSASLSVGTSNESREVDFIAAPGASITTLKVFQNGITAGISVSGSKSFYDSKPTENAATAAPGYYGGDRRSNWRLGIFPFAEYAFSDTWQLRTVFGWFNYRNVYGDDNQWRLIRIYDYQSVGVGYSLTRDIYIYPNIQFVPTDIRDDMTNFAVSATLNIF